MKKNTKTSGIQKQSILIKNMNDLNDKTKENVKKLFYSEDLCSCQIALKTKIPIAVVRDIIIEDLIYKNNHN